MKLTSQRLSEVPEHVRRALYWAGYLLGVIGSGIVVVVAAIAAASPDFAMPLWLVVTQAVIAFVVTQLNLLAGSNMPSFEDVVEDTGYEPEHARDI